MDKPQAIIFYGPPCSGKSTICRMMSEKTGYQILSPDLIRHSNLFDNTDMYSPSYTDEIFDILVSQINESARASRSMIIEGMFLTNKTRSRILDLFNILTLKIVYVTADLLTLQARLLSRSEEGSLNVLHRKVPLKKEDLAKFYVNSVPPKDKSLIIDTTNDGIYVSLLSAEQIASRKFSYEFLLENLILHND